MTKIYFVVHVLLRFIFVANVVGRSKTVSSTKYNL